MDDDLQARDLAAFWHPCAQMRDYRDFPPLPVVGATGSVLELADGRKILDAISSWWCKSLGHRHPALLRALQEQAAQFDHVIVANTTNAGLVRLCERLLAAANGLPSSAWGGDAPLGRQPGWFGKVFLADNGSTAVEIALKLALQAQAQRGQPQRTRFLALADGYHGETVATLSLGDCDLYAHPYRPVMFPVDKLDGLPRRTGPEDPAWSDAGAEWPVIAAQLERHAPTLAAIVYEPVLQAAGGMRLYSPDLLRRLRAWADAQGVYLIADEIAAGMGRLGPILASHLADPAHPTVALPDLACLSKGLTGGVLPLSAVVLRDELYDLFDANYDEHKAFLHSNTHTGNALAVAVANAVLDVLAAEDIAGRVAVLGPRLRTGLQSLRRDGLPLTGVRGCGMVAAADLVGPDGTALPVADRTGYRVYQEAVRRGALLRPLGDTVYLFPPLTVTNDDIDAMVAILGESILAVCGG